MYYISETNQRLAGTNTLAFYEHSLIKTVKSVKTFYLSGQNYNKNLTVVHFFQRNLWQLKILTLVHRCIICTVNYASYQ